jgi:hypothetical protein
VVVVLTDGRGARIESATLAVQAADATGIHGSDFPTKSCQTKDTWKLDAGYLVFGEGPRHPLLMAPRNYGTLPPAPPSAPTFLKKDDNPDFLVLPAPSPLLVLSKSSLDPNTATWLCRAWTPRRHARRGEPMSVQLPARGDRGRSARVRDGGRRPARDVGRSRDGEIPPEVRLLTPWDSRRRVERHGEKGKA